MKRTMKQFRFIGDQVDADGYGKDGGVIPEIGKVYNEDQVFCHCTVSEWSKDRFLDICKEWEEVINEKSK